jgi:hypothetical protein
MTIADYSIWSSLLILELLVEIDEKKFPKLKQYLKMLESHPNYSLNYEGARKQVDFIDRCMEKARNYHINKFELMYPRPI